MQSDPTTTDLTAPDLAPEDLEMIARMTRAELLAAAEQEDGWIAHVQRVGRWPSDRNAKSVALWSARASACRAAAEGLS